MQYVMCHGKIFRFFIVPISNTHRTIKRCHFRMQRAIVKVLFDIIFFNEFPVDCYHQICCFKCVVRD